MSSENDSQQDNGSADQKAQRNPWSHMIRGMWRTPLGLFGLGITTVSATIMLFGAVIDMLGLIDNPYVGIIIYMILPGGMLLGLGLIPMAAWLRRRKWHNHRVEKEHLLINLSK